MVTVMSTQRGNTSIVTRPPTTASKDVFLALLEDMRVIELYISSITGVNDDIRFRALLQPIRELQQEQKKISAAVVNSEKKILAAVDELKALVSEQTRKSFQVKGTQFEVM